MTDITKGLGDRIREAAQRVGGIAELARLTGIPISSLNENLRGRKLSVERLVAIGQATKVPLDWLATGDGLPEWRVGRNGEELKGVQRPEPHPKRPDAETATAEINPMPTRQGSDHRNQGELGLLNVEDLAAVIQGVKEFLSTHGLRPSEEREAWLVATSYLTAQAGERPVTPGAVRRNLEKLLLDQ